VSPLCGCTNVLAQAKGICFTLTRRWCCRWMLIREWCPIRNRARSRS
jgi:hypothetical protein